MARPPFEEIEHTADWSIRVRGRNHAALFIAAARGMFSLLAESPAELVAVRRVELTALDVETLLVDWLNELLYVAESEALLFVEFEIHRLEGVAIEASSAVDADPVRLEATARGGPAPELKKTIKAATFSSLSIQRVPDGLQVDLVFDV